MTVYLLIKGDDIIGEVDMSPGDKTALPLVPEGMSLMLAKRITTLAANMTSSTADAMTALGLTDRREVLPVNGKI
jgi:hypothetical protein